MNTRVGLEILDAAVQRAADLDSGRTVCVYRVNLSPCASVVPAQAGLDGV